MSAPASTHPADGVLAEFVLGKLTDAAVERHLASCSDCQARAAAANPTDTLLMLVATVGSKLGAGVTALAIDATPADFTRPAPAGPDVLAGLAGHPRYRLLQPLGRGGMGVVWLAEHTLMGRVVALKLIHPRLLDRPGAVERFRREVRAAARLNHPNVVAAHDADEADGAHFLVMEYIPGETLSAAVGRGPLPVAAACRAARDAARGLAHAHAAGLVHRDVKPGNLIRTADGIVKVLDFGLVGLGADGDGLTGENVVMGTPDYVAPEQADDPAAADARSDVYALGCTLYHLLAGRVPYPTPSALRKLDAHRDPAVEPAPLPGLPAGLAAVLARMLAKDRATRYPSADEVAAALEPFTQAEPAVPPPRRRARTWVAIAAGLLFAAAAVAAGVAIIRDKDGKEVARVQVPDGGTVEVKPDAGSAPAVLPRDPRVLIGHNMRVRAVIFSADGKTVYSASDDGTARAWNAATGRQAAEYRHADRVLSLALVDAGRTLVTTTEFGLRAWDLATGKEAAPFPRFDPRDAGGSLAASPDGKRVASGALNGTVRVWDVATRAVVREWKSDNGLPTYSVAWSPGGSAVAAGMDVTLGVFDPNTGTPLFRKTGTQGLTRVAFSPDGKYILTDGWEGRVRVHDADGGAIVKEFIAGEVNGATGSVVTGAPAGRLLTVGRGFFIDVWDWKTGTRQTSLTGHTARVIAAAVSPDGRWIATGSEDATVRLWPLPAGGRP